MLSDVVSSVLLGHMKSLWLSYSPFSTQASKMYWNTQVQASPPRTHLGWFLSLQKKDSGDLMIDVGKVRVR